MADECKSVSDNELSNYGTTNLSHLNESASGSTRSILKQVKCPPSSTKHNVGRFVNVWLPAMEKYGLDYTGVGEIVGGSSNKAMKKTAIGTNRFFKLPEKCGIGSDYQCYNQDKYLYLKTYPLGKIPNCSIENGNVKSMPSTKVPGGLGIIGGITEDLYNLDVSDVMKSTIRKGPYVTEGCMKARLPVGDSLLVSSKKRKNSENALLNGGGWWIEEHCIPRQPTMKKEYGGETFEIPYSKSKCVEKFQNINKFDKKSNDIFFSICSISLLILLTFGNITR